MKVVAIHGYPLDRRMWGPLVDQVEALGPGVTVVAPDLRGRGTSRRPAASVHTMSLLADDLAEDLDSLAPEGEPFVLAGLSMGGYVLFEVLKRHRRRLGDRLRGLVLCDTRAGADDDAGRAKRKEAIGAIRAHGIEAARDAMLPKLLARGSKGTEVEALVTSMIVSTPAATACADLAGMGVRDEGFEALSAFDKPILLVVGEEDAITPPDDAEAMAAVVTQAPYVRLLTVEGAGHLEPLERPLEVAAGIAELVRRAG